MLVSLWFVWIINPYLLGAGEFSSHVMHKLMEGDAESCQLVTAVHDGRWWWSGTIPSGTPEFMTALNSVLFWFLLELADSWITFMLLYRYFCKSHRCVAVEGPWRWSFISVVSFKLLLNCLSCVVLLVTSWQLCSSLHVAAEESPIEYSCMNSLHSLWSGSQKHQLKACEGFCNWVLITFLCSCGGGSMIWRRMLWAANAVSLSCHLLIHMRTRGGIFLVIVILVVLSLVNLLLFVSLCKSYHTREEQCNMKQLWHKTVLKWIHSNNYISFPILARPAMSSRFLKHNLCFNLNCAYIPGWAVDFKDISFAWISSTSHLLSPVEEESVAAAEGKMKLDVLLGLKAPPSRLSNSWQNFVWKKSS